MKLQEIFLLIILLTAPMSWRLDRHKTGWVMMVTTFIVYSWFSPLAVAVLAGSSLLQYFCWRWRADKMPRLLKLLPVIIPMLALILFKLAFAFQHWLIPLGLSYYAFRQIHVAFEVYKRTMAPPTLRAYGAYLLFLPVILIGPIHRMPEFERSLRRRKWNPVMFSEGLERILYGFVKISFLGNFVCSVWIREYASTVHGDALRVYLQAIVFTCNAYFQFAGFSDLAIGGGMIWGIKVMENFNAPFMATNMQSFWQRWHISLSSWCRDYVFQPVAGFTRNAWVALLAAMLVLALWHEISVRYIAWGAVQTIFILLTVFFRKRLPAVSDFINHDHIGRWIGRIWVFHLFTFSSILIGSETIGSLGSMLKNIF